MGKLFGTSGIRGVVNEDLQPELALRVGLGLATYLGNKGEVVVGKDPRTSSDMIEHSLVSGLLAGGCDVKEIGIVPTPALSFATRRLAAAAGIMITASHNPPEYNGIKCWGSDGMAFTPKQEDELELRMENPNPVGWERIGKIETRDILPDYIREIAGRFSLGKKYRVVVDCGNGAGSLVTPSLLRELGCAVVSLNSHLDGHFPGRGLEPTAENLAELSTVVRSIGADLGLAHDGDADRIAAVDELGRVAQPDKLLALISAHQVKRRGNTVVTTVDASRVIDECVNRRGGKVVRTKVGDVNVAIALREREGVFGGEPSGAWIFPEVHPVPDGPLAAAKILELLDSTGKRPSELLDALPGYPMVREKLACPNERKSETMKKLEAGLLKEFPDVVEVLKIDGLRLELKEGWVLVRPSGTEPYIRVTAEGRTLAQAKEIASKATVVLKRVIQA